MAHSPLDNSRHPTFRNRERIGYGNGMWLGGGLAMEVQPGLLRGHLPVCRDLSVDPAAKQVVEEPYDLSTSILQLRGWKQNIRKNKIKKLSPFSGLTPHAKGLP